MVVIAKQDLEGTCKEGQRMFVTTHFGDFFLHISAGNTRKVSRKWINKFFNIIKEGY